MKILIKILAFTLSLLILLAGCSSHTSSEGKIEESDQSSDIVVETDSLPKEEEQIETEQSKEPIVEEQPEEEIPESSNPSSNEEPNEISQENVEDAFVDVIEVAPVSQQEMEAILVEALPAVPTVLSTVASGTHVDQNDEAIIDYSNTADGYVMVKYTGSTQSRIKVMVKGPYTTYKYDLPKNSWTVFPLSDGNGYYQIGVYRNVTGTKYANVLSTEMQVSLYDQFAPFLRPNQYVNYWEGSNVVTVGSQIVSGSDSALKKVEKVYDYVVANLSYDSQKASTVQSGYLPVLDQVLQSKKGICFDYAALMTAMLRSQNVPCKLMVGYAGQTYHAWINVWTEESGWVDGAIFFDGSRWKRMDPTFASSSHQSSEIMDFISRDVNYTVKYQY